MGGGEGGERSDMRFGGRGKGDFSLSDRSRTSTPTIIDIIDLLLGNLFNILATYRAIKSVNHTNLVGGKCKDQGQIIYFVFVNLFITDLYLQRLIYRFMTMCLQPYYSKGRTVLLVKQGC